MRSLLAPALAFFLPCIIAVAVMFLSWRWTDAGQLGRLLKKHNLGASFAPLHQLLDVPDLWFQQFGYAFGLIAAAGLIWGGIQLTRPASRRFGLLALWVLAASCPLVLLTNWSRVGYPGSYFIEAVFCCGALGGVLSYRLLQRYCPRPIPRPAAVAFAALMLALLGAGSADQCLFGGRIAHLTGVNTSWGMVRPDSGIKAVGGYIREHVPADSVVLSLHDNKGMELPLVEYYTDRHALADYDLKPAMYAPILETLGESVDVVIVQAGDEKLLDSLPGFERVCTVRRDTRPVRFIYARRALGLTQVDEETALLNDRYNRCYRPQRVPVALSTPRDFEACFRAYSAKIKQLKKAARTRQTLCSAPPR